MKYHIIYFLDAQNNVSLKEDYKTLNDAINSLEKVATEHIREQQGKQQVQLCRQYDKTSAQLLADPTIREGLYLIKDGTCIHLYEKKNTIIPGTIWNSYEMKIFQVG